MHNVKKLKKNGRDVGKNKRKKNGASHKIGSGSWEKNNFFFKVTFWKSPN